MEIPQIEAYNKFVVSHKVIHRGVTYGLSLIEVRGTSVIVKPFERETPSTTFHSGTIRILRANATSSSDWHRDGDVPILLKE